MKRKPDYIVERAVHGDNFKNKVISLLVGQYNITSDEALIAFETCMITDYAVVKPVCKEYPNGVMIATNFCRQKVVIG